MSRDFIVHCVMVYFIVKVNIRETNIKAELEREDTHHDLHELKTVLNSCRPRMCFENYLDENKQDHVILLDYVKLYLKIEDYEAELVHIQQQKDTYTEVLGQPDFDQDEIRASIRRIEDTEIYTKNQIGDGRLALSDLFHNSEDQFVNCFAKYETLIDQKESFINMQYQKVDER